ncbi:nucleotidyl transferase AbiEii/AbiGii toxin family protein [Paraburkholderia sp. CNPSo 3274]|uniref:nucleotidyl transferase AbiEii/AbiGii toxin family protein n=1 Tax=Paraburkholderia sp. CNPSo 3274 TaxID=2940932 RepID=UPI0020B85CF2|nr:nucleotidyl transferase AbiEii/AbiGii toxin family protein [Paraburkholderia sp. CNPSo 3274]MCP3712857.1 nucleotidyl transferase AbiEii/AbiGii toxin family protein [Paraburkholderia sp. CNPSo 3274]
MNDIYLDTVRLLLSIAPDVFDTPNFAMKGGTALNLFLQNLPRLSVDIDVVYTDHVPDRDAALKHIGEELARAKAAIERQGFHAKYSQTAANGKQKGSDVKLTVFSDETSVKVEVNYVFRGTLLVPQSRQLVQAAREKFNVDVALPTLHEAELYGSKLVAALDRQHPRDIFDVMHMYEMFGLRGDFVDAFVGYVAGHDRPVHELLGASAKSLESAHDAEFVGMTLEEVSVETLQTVQARLHHELPRAITQQHREFLLSLVRLAPDWGLMPYAHLKDMPAIRWKLQNLEKLKNRNAEKFDAQERLLRECFDALDT